MTHERRIHVWAFLTAMSVALLVFATVRPWKAPAKVATWDAIAVAVVALGATPDAGASGPPPPPVSGPQQRVEPIAVQLARVRAAQAAGACVGDPTSPADLNADGRLDGRDWQAMRRAVGSAAGDDRYYPAVDFDMNGAVTEADVRSFCDAFNSANPAYPPHRYECRCRTKHARPDAPPN